ncbi:MAG: hypothetical protein AB2693_32960 [Candidatus Thiodiazotropha sp.]
MKEDISNSFKQISCPLRVSAAEKIVKYDIVRKVFSLKEGRFFLVRVFHIGA